MQVNGSGGGYFYGPFVSTQTIGPFINVTPDPVAGVYGPWLHLPAPILTGRGRWLELRAWPNVLGSLYFIQIAMGAAGSEVVFQPSDGSGFSVDWAAVVPWTVPYIVAFPTSTGIGRELSIRCSSTPGFGSPLAVEIHLWN